MKRYTPQETFFRKAKKEGLRSRSAYKLKEIQRKFNVIKKRNMVLDLGCAPGGFLQVIREYVGDEGLVVGIDKSHTVPLNYPNVHIYMEDVRICEIESILKKEGISGFDLVTCDLSPNLSGIRETDERNIMELFEACVKIVEKSLRKGGNFVIKSFFLTTLEKVRKELEKLFERCILFKPEASRKESSEIYIICLKKLA